MLTSPPLSTSSSMNSSSTSLFDFVVYDVDLFVFTVSIFCVYMKVIVWFFFAAFVDADIVVVEPSA